MKASACWALQVLHLQASSSAPRPLEGYGAARAGPPLLSASLWKRLDPRYPAASACYFCARAMQRRNTYSPYIRRSET
ncbi:hypothetical protein DER46DRAFT_339880 [Fusarium sp. MPI-SDFR-AT-0072]|nr:hypothetical protein DER46DRAFT_339880 [Fusarium sp. MPI-SDFR-AT-0072]